MSIQTDLKDHYPELATVVGDRVKVVGNWRVYGKTKEAAVFSIEVLLPDDYPSSPPQVYEVGGAIPRSADRHVNPDGSACLFAPPDRWYKCPPGTELKAFLDGPVREYFFSQAFYDLTRRWPFGEWGHGDLGIVEFYAERLGLLNILAIRIFLNHAANPKAFRHWQCPCGSGHKAIQCHGPKIIELSRVVPPFELAEGARAANNLLAKGMTVCSVRNTARGSS